MKSDVEYLGNAHVLAVIVALKWGSKYNINKIVYTRHFLFVEHGTLTIQRWIHHLMLILNS